MINEQFISRYLSSDTIECEIMSLDVNISEPDEFNCTELHTSIEELANLKGITDFIYHVDYVCGKGENYIANIFRVLIKNEDNKLSVIVKTLVNTARQELFYELHKREANVYRQVATKFNKLQESLEVEDRLVIAQCLYSTIEKSNEVIILEDMVEQGFAIDNKLSKYEFLELHQIATVMSELAKLHGLSFVCENKDAEYFAKLKTEFRDLVFQNNFLNKSKLRSYFTESYEMSVNLVTDLEAKRKLEKVKPHLMEILQKFVEPGDLNVLCHGDCWINNMLLKYEENKPTKVCFIDFQTLRYCNPATDIVHFMYLSMDSKQISEHFEDLLNVYHESLKSFLIKFNLDVTELYPLEVFTNDVKNHLPFGLLIALIELRIVTLSAEQDATLTECKNRPESEVKIHGFIDFYKLLVNNLVQECLDNGVIEQLLGLINT